MLKIGILGAGHLGKIHLRIVASSPTYELVGFYDPDAKAVAKLVKEAIEIFLENEDIFFTSAVFNQSSKTRSEVGALLVKILAYDALNDEDLDAYIDQQYQESFDFITN